MRSMKRKVERQWSKRPRPIPYQGGVLLRQRKDKIMNRCFLTSGGSSPGGILLPIGYIRPDRRMEEQRVLRNEGDLRAQLLLAESLDVPSIQGDASLLGMKIAQEQVRQGRLPCPEVAMMPTFSPGRREREKFSSTGCPAS